MSEEQSYMYNSFSRWWSYLIVSWNNHCVIISKFGVNLVRIFPHLDWIRSHSLSLSVFSLNAGKYGPEYLRIRYFRSKSYLKFPNKRNDMQLNKYTNYHVTVKSHLPVYLHNSVHSKCCLLKRQPFMQLVLQLCLIRSVDRTIPFSIDFHRHSLLLTHFRPMFQLFRNQVVGFY